MSEEQPKSWVDEVAAQINVNKSSSFFSQKQEKQEPSPQSTTNPFAEVNKEKDQST